ncbi:MAG: hypothetical protein Q9182_006937 [Xanthomendoza sp. 2 TL-2023]
MTSPVQNPSATARCSNDGKDMIDSGNQQQHNKAGNAGHDRSPVLKESTPQPTKGFMTDMAEKEEVLDRTYPSPSKRFIIIATLCVGTLLEAIDITIIGVAVPTISAAFNALVDVGWYGSAYLLCLTVLQPVFGVIYKFFDPKKVHLSSVLVFEAGSIILASAHTSPIFVLGRAVTGCGGAGILQGALCIVALTVPLEKRPLYLSIVVSSFGAATYFGPIMGGALTDRASWRWCFWLDVPIGGVVAIIIILFLKLEGTGNAER